MKSIKKILVPIDLSEHSAIALDFALALAQAYQAETKVLNIYNPYEAVAQVGDGWVVSHVMDFEQKLLTFLEAKFGDLQEATKKYCFTYEARIGAPIETIVDLSEGYDCVVMGTTGQKGWGAIMFGTTATGVAQKAACPVLLVPANCIYKNIKNIIYACDIEHTSTKQVNAMISIAELFNADVQLLFVKTSEHRDRLYAKEMDNIERLFLINAPEMSVTIRAMSDDSVVEGVHHYAQEIKADLIVVVTQHRNFWGRLMHSSMTKEIVMYAEEPILVVHQD